VKDGEKSKVEHVMNAVKAKKVINEKKMKKVYNRVLCLRYKGEGEGEVCNRIKRQLVGVGGVGGVGGVVGVGLWRRLCFAK